MVANVLLEAVAAGRTSVLARIWLGVSGVMMAISAPPIFVITMYAEQRMSSWAGHAQTPNSALQGITAVGKTSVLARIWLGVSGVMMAISASLAIVQVGNANHNSSG
jgi:hypothetical protein